MYPLCWILHLDYSSPRQLEHMFAEHHHFRLMSTRPKVTSHNKHEMPGMNASTGQTAINQPSVMLPFSRFILFSHHSAVVYPREYLSGFLVAGCRSWRQWVTWQSIMCSCFELCCSWTKSHLTHLMYDRVSNLIGAICGYCEININNTIIINITTL